MGKVSRGGPEKAEAAERSVEEPLPSDIPAGVLAGEALAIAPEDAASTDLGASEEPAVAADGEVIESIDGGVVDTTGSGVTGGADVIDEPANGTEVAAASPSPSDVLPPNLTTENPTSGISGAMMTTMIVPPGTVLPGMVLTGMPPGISLQRMTTPGMASSGMDPGMMPPGMMPPGMTPGVAMGMSPTTNAAAHAQIAMLEQVPPHPAPRSPLPARPGAWSRAQRPTTAPVR